MSYTNLLTHIVFATKERRPFLAERDVRTQVHAYLGGIVRNVRGTAIAIGGVADHVHLLVLLPPTITIADVVRITKANTSGYIHDRWRPLANFAWQEKYAAFSVSRSIAPRVARYIATQEAHHRRTSFGHELSALLERNGVAPDAPAGARG